jgi:hypothetical protein
MSTAKMLVSAVGTHRGNGEHVDRRHERDGHGVAQRGHDAAARQRRAFHLQRPR